MKISTTIAGVGLALLAYPHFTHANDDIKVNGFLTIGAGFALIDDDEDSGANSSDSLYGSSSNETIRSYEENLTFHQETILGMQVVAPISEKLSLTGQLVTRGIQDYNVEAAWAYASYEASENLTLRMGRFRIPFYLYSDYLEVGYAYHWVSPPNEMYVLPFESIDGIDAVYNMPIGPFDATIQAYAGSVNDDFTNVDKDFSILTVIRNQVGLVFTVEYDWLTLRASAHTNNSSYPEFGDFYSEALEPVGGTIDGLAGTLIGIGDQLDSNPISQPLSEGYYTAAQGLYLNEERFNFAELGMRIDWNNILLVAEASELNPSGGPVADVSRWFASAGYTFNDFMFHLTYTEARDTQSDISKTIYDLSDLSQELGQTSNLLTQAVDGVTRSLMTTGNTITAGIRYDFTAGAALKLEYSEIEDDQEASGSLFRITVDMVF